MLAKTPESPYWAVIFTSSWEGSTRADASEYGQTADEMVRLASEQPGFLGVDSVRDAEGVGITVSYWRSEQDIAAWRAHADHRTAQRMGREKWYRAYTLRIARVERAYGFERNG